MNIEELKRTAARDAADPNYAATLDTTRVVYNEAVAAAARDAKVVYDSAFPDNDELKSCVKEFFNAYLNIREVSDSGHIRSPITISCARCMKMEPLGILLEKMRVLSGADLPYDEPEDNDDEDAD